MTGATSLYYSGSNEFGISEWEQIISNLITYGDVIWLRSRWDFSPAIPDEHRFLLERVGRELMEAGRITTWELENTLSRQSRRIDRIITDEEQRTLYERVNHAILAGTGQPLREDTSGNVERTSRFIEYRYEVWNLGLATLCGCLGIVFRRDFAAGVPFADYYKYHMINENYTRRLFETFQIGNLSTLSANDIVELQKHATFFRAKVDKLMQDSVYGIPADHDTIVRKLESLYTEYHANINALIAEKSNRQLAKGVARESVLEIAGLFFGVLGLVPLAEKLVEWLTGESKYGFILYMHQLKQKTELRRRGGG